MRNNMKLVKIAYHRNGVMGQGFYAVAFKFLDDGICHNMIATVFGPDPENSGEVQPCNGHLAVLDADCAAAGLLDRPQNKWRDDHFEPQLRQWIACWLLDDVIRIQALVPDEALAA